MLASCSEQSGLGQDLRIRSALRHCFPLCLPLVIVSKVISLFTPTSEPDVRLSPHPAPSASFAVNSTISHTRSLTLFLPRKRPETYPPPFFDRGNDHGVIASFPAWTSLLSFVELYDPSLLHLMKRSIDHTKHIDHLVVAR